MEYNNSNANGIIKHICLNKKISLYICLYSKDREKNNKKRFFSLGIFTKVRGCKRKTDVLHLLCVFVIVLFFFFVDMCIFIYLFTLASQQLWKLLISSFHSYYFLPRLFSSFKQWREMPGKIVVLCRTVWVIFFLFFFLLFSINGASRQ